MIYDTQTLNNKYKEYSNINQKISLEVKNGSLVRIKRGLFSDEIKIDAPVLANMCCDPSYISFEYAMSYYGLIPEYVSMYTCACYGKKNYKLFRSNGKAFEYRSVPNDVYAYGITYLKNENGIRYKIASKEKALCDTLYSKYPVRTIADLKILLFDDLRIDEEEFLKLDFEFIKSIAPKYHSNTLNTLNLYLKELKKLYD